MRQQRCRPLQHQRQSHLSLNGRPQALQIIASHSPVRGRGAGPYQPHHRRRNREKLPRFRLIPGPSETDNPHRRMVACPSALARMWRCPSKADPKGSPLSIASALAGSESGVALPANATRARRRPSRAGRGARATWRGMRLPTNGAGSKRDGLAVRRSAGAAGAAGNSSRHRSAA